MAQVTLVDFPETKVAVLEHKGDPALEGETINRLIQWRMAQGLMGAEHKSYGVHYNNPVTTPAKDYRVDFCIATQQKVAGNEWGVVNKVIPAGRCAMLRHAGSRQSIAAAHYLCEIWLPASNETLGHFPLFFHYVNVGPDLDEAEMITDVYLPLS